MDALTITSERAALALLDDALERQPDSPGAYIESRTDLSPAVRKRAAGLLAAHLKASDSFRTGGAHTILKSEPPERVGSYRILRCLGRGGMGAVYLGERISGDFDHVVAIKLIHPGLFSEELTERFRRERQILATLNHPHIARLYDGGETENAEPYIVMEYVEGLPLEQWMEEQQPTLDRKLDLFGQICDAVQFAHQNLIIHRDLTPANVLVKQNDETKLIDFGISRPTDDTEELRTDGSGGSATPGFAAPERARGSASNTLSDIYSLGRLLEFLIQGESSGEIDAIIAKACCNDPEGRYATARDMLGDLNNHRSNFPVAAFSDARSYRLRKFLWRQKLTMGIAASIVLLLVGGLGSTYWAYSRVERERARAEQSFAETRAIARTMMFDVYDEVSRVPGSVPARLLLADTAQRYLESLASDRNADVDVRYDAAQGYFRLAEVVGARTGGGTIGLTSRAKQYYERSRALLEELHAARPGRRDIRASLGQVLAMMADSALFSDGNFQTAKASAVRARFLLDAIARLDAESAGALILTYVHEGNALAWEGEPEPAGAVYRSGLQRLEDLPQALQSAPPVLRAEADLLRMMGAYHSYFQRPEEARTALDRSLAIRRLVAAQTGNAPQDIYGLVTILQAVARRAFAGGDVARADALASEAVDLARQGMATGPNDVGPQELFTQVAIFKGHVLATRGRMREAVALVDEAIALKRSLIEKSGNVVSGPMTLAVRLQEASEVYLLAGERSHACPIIREAVGIMRDYEKTAELPIANRREHLEPMLAALPGC